MVKILVLHLIISFFLFASDDLFESKIINMTNKAIYAKHKNFINTLFKDRQKFLLNFDNPNSTSFKINTIKIIKVLQKNGLFQNELNQVTNVELTFKFGQANKSLIAIKLIQEALNAIGYNFFIPTQASYNDFVKLTMSIKTSTPIDPILLFNEFKKRGIEILDIEKTQNAKWSYLIDTTHAHLYNVVQMQKDITQKIQKNSKEIIVKLKDYSLEDKQPMKYITITSSASNTWYPKVIFYDENLNILQIKKINKIVKQIKFKISPGSLYIKLSDIYRNQNYKYGFYVQIN